MEFNAWALLTDAGLIGALLAVGAGLRAWIKPLRSLLVPSSVIGGALGLALGPSGLAILPFSEEFGNYSSVLVVIVFACIAINTDFRADIVGRSIGQFFGYTIFMYSIQVVFGIVLVLLLLKPVFGVNDSFGVVLFAGWAGGFGTAAAMGQVFAEAGYPEITDLAITSATVGLLIGITGGIILAKVGAERGYAKHYAGLSSIPKEVRTGVLSDTQERPIIGRHVFSGSSVESLAFQVGIIAAISAAAYGVQLWLKELMPGISVPVFSVAFLIGLLVNVLFKRFKANRLVDESSMNSISGVATDGLILCGIASISPTVVADYAIPLLILFIGGLALVLLVGLVIAPRVLTENWFEKQIFTFGWALGAVPQGIALLRIVDPKMESRTLEEYALQGVANQNEILAVTFVPTLIIAGLAWTAAGIWGGAAILAILLAFALSRRKSASRSPAVH